MAPTIFLTNFKNTLFKLENLNKDITDGVNGNIDFNERIVFNIKTFKVFNHEALHLSSILNGNIPKMLLPFFEGYTQLLTERYFNETPGVSYRLETMILKNLELILGKDLMETLFFKGNFQEIISELYKYESEKNIQSFIVSFNVLFDIHENYDFVDKTELFQHHLNVVFEFLFSCLKNKIDNIDNFSEIQRILFLGEWYPTITITTNKKCLSFSTLNSNLFNEFVNQVLYNNYVNKNKRH